MSKPLDFAYFHSTTTFYTAPKSGHISKFINQHYIIGVLEKQMHNVIHVVEIGSVLFLVDFWSQFLITQHCHNTTTEVFLRHHCSTTTVNLPNSENSRLGRKRRKESKQIRIPKTVDFSGVALTTFKILSFSSPNARISAKSAKPSAQRGRKSRRPSKPTKSTVFRILTETNMNSMSTKSIKNEIGPN